MNKLFLVFIWGSTYIFTLSLCSASEPNYAKIIKLPLKERTKKIVKLEKDLSKGENIVKCRKINSGMHDSLLVTYKNGMEGILKMDNDENPDIYSFVNHEVAAYKLAKYLGITRVPPTNLVSIDSKQVLKGKIKFADEECHNILMTIANKKLTIQGSVQLKVKGAADYVSFKGFEKSKELQLFDYLIFNCDRPRNKNLVQVEGEPFYIDHSLAFLSYEKLEQIHKTKEHQNFCFETLMLYKKNLSLLCEYVLQGNIFSALSGLSFSRLEEMLDDHVSRPRQLDLKKRIDKLINTCKVPDFNEINSVKPGLCSEVK